MLVTIVFPNGTTWWTADDAIRETDGGVCGWLATGAELSVVARWLVSLPDVQVTHRRQA